MGDEKIEILKNNFSNRIMFIISVLFLLAITVSSVNAAENTTDLGNLVTSASDNSVVELGEGTYTKNVTNINIDKNITIVGKGADKTIIDANKAGRIFKIQYNGTLTLINLTLINGNTTNSYWGGAIYNEGKLSVTNCNFTNNTASTYGGTIYNEGILSLTNCAFRNNKASAEGGAIFNDGRSSISNCSFINNTANNGGAISNMNYNTPDGILTVTDCTFINNKADGGGAIYDCGHDNKISIRKSIFINNTATYNGGAIYIYFNGPYYDISDSIFINNSAGSGGALYIINSSITNCSFIDNKAEFYGGAIYSYGYSMNIICSNFTGNTAINGGAIILTNATDITINDSILSNNTAENGSAIYKGLYGYNPNLTINNSNFTDNNGGPVLYLYGNETKITGCNIINNSQGILIPEDSDATINYNRIFNNTNNTGYNLDDGGIGSNLDFNWWGDNHPKVNGTINNYFVMNVTNLTSLDSNGTVTFNYTFRLNTNDSADNSLLPYFVTNVYTNVTTGIIESFDARFDRTFDITVNENGSILYTFITDNEIQTLEGTVTIRDPENPIDPDDPTTPENPVEPIDPIDPVDPNDNGNESAKNPVAASTAMRETGMPIIAILLVLLSSLGLIIRKK